jgi:2-deoxy-D-gluconate 3-dehydrogenase
MQMFNLSGKIAIVTGGNGGIGFGMVKGLAKAGASVVIVGRNKEKNFNSVAEIKSMGGNAIAVVADVCDSQAVNQMVKHVISQLGAIHILINNAGTSVRKRPEDLTEEDWHYVMNTNLTSSFLCSKACYPEMKKAGGGKILNNGSMLSIFGSPWGAAYGASKGGIMQYTRSQAVAWGPDNIQVNCFLPGWINTELTKSAREYAPELNDKVLSRTPAGRWGQPDDLAGLAVFMASQASDFLTGVAIPIDGGFSVTI